jgi:hypothetical protein
MGLTTAAKDRWAFTTKGMCCNFVVEPKSGQMISNLVRRREQTENEAVQ